MPTFATRLSKAAGRGGRIILACDYAGAASGEVVQRAVSDIGRLSGYLCGIKINLHLLLPLSARDISRITDAGHSDGLACIADIKLNDIGSTNRAALDALWGMGFDGVIVNPIMGRGSLEDVVTLAHDDGNGVVSLCHMSAPQAADMYGTAVLRNGRREPLHRIFLDMAASCGVDGIVVGATYPGVIRACKESNPELPILSPGVGVQGGNAKTAVSAGTDYVIAGRSITESKNPVDAAGQLRDLCA